MKKYILTIVGYEDVPYDVVVVANNEEEAIDKLVDKLVDEESEDVIDYYDIYDNCETGQTVDEAVLENGFVCGGESGGYIKLLEIKEFKTEA